MELFKVEEMSDVFLDGPPRIDLRGEDARRVGTNELFKTGGSAPNAFYEGGKEPDGKIEPECPLRPGKGRHAVSRNTIKDDVARGRSAGRTERSGIMDASTARASECRA